MHEKKRVLVVVRWPLGGIRTYMKYVYQHLCNNYDFTIIASNTCEKGALEEDAKEIGAKLIFFNESNIFRTIGLIFSHLAREQYALIQSHGFISAAYVYVANIFHRIQHIVTIHGILEERLLTGFKGRLKRALIGKVLRRVSAIYCVGNDMKEHLICHFPFVPNDKFLVIPNGIDISRFNSDVKGNLKLRADFGIREGIFLIGFLGRFMAQKGFDCLINAMEILDKSSEQRDYKVMAVGSGDCLTHYRDIIAVKGLQHRFIFIPFQSDIAAIYPLLDVVVMPSIWEASGLLAMEALCMGVPLIASNCVGLRETVRGTPALVFEPGNAEQLAERLRCISQNSAHLEFKSFASQAVQMFDSGLTAKRVEMVFKSIADNAKFL